MVGSEAKGPTTYPTITPTKTMIILRIFLATLHEIYFLLWWGLW